MRHNNLTIEKAFVSLTFVFVLSTSFTYTVKANDFDDNYEYDYELYNSLSELEQKDKKVLEKLNALDKRSMSGNVFQAGVVQFTYGTSIPTIVCAVLEITDISLEKGERILSVQIGDGARWSIESAISGSYENSVEHIIVKPLDIALKTSLLIATDRRTYHLRLKSSKADFMPAVKFYYPNQALESTNSFELLKRQRQEPSSMQYANYDRKPNQEALQKVSFNQNSKGKVSKKANRQYIFNLKGDRKVVPINAYTDGQKTYIQMAKNSKADFMPNLSLVTQKSGLFSKEQLSQVNYRIIANTYVVDGIYDHLTLTLNAEGKTYRADIIKRA